MSETDDKKDPELLRKWVFAGGYMFGAIVAVESYDAIERGIITEFGGFISVLFILVWFLVMSYWLEGIE